MIGWAQITLCHVQMILKHASETLLQATDYYCHNYWNRRNVFNQDSFVVTNSVATDIKSSLCVSDLWTCKIKQWLYLSWDIVVLSQVLICFKAEQDLSLTAFVVIYWLLWLLLIVFLFGVVRDFLKSPWWCWCLQLTNWLMFSSVHRMSLTVFVTAYCEYHFQEKNKQHETGIVFVICSINKQRFHLRIYFVARLVEPWFNARHCVVQWF